jgi:plastocyanin
MRGLVRAAAVAVLMVFAVPASRAADFFVTQKNNHFNVTALKIKVGDTVHFKNDDAHYHNVFSLTDGHSFDLGSYGQNQVKKRTFDKAGKVEIECAIHPAMKLIIDVAN